MRLGLNQSYEDSEAEAWSSRRDRVEDKEATGSRRDGVVTHRDAETRRKAR